MVTSQVVRLHQVGDYLVTSLAVVGIAILIGLNLWEEAHQRGFAAGVDSARCDKRVVNRMDQYSGEELMRIGRARIRLEKIK